MQLIMFFIDRNKPLRNNQEFCMMGKNCTKHLLIKSPTLWIVLAAAIVLWEV